MSIISAPEAVQEIIAKTTTNKISCPVMRKPI